MAVSANCVKRRHVPLATPAPSSPREFHVQVYPYGRGHTYCYAVRWQAEIDCGPRGMPGRRHFIVPEVDGASDVDELAHTGEFSVPWPTGCDEGLMEVNIRLRPSFADCSSAPCRGLVSTYNPELICRIQCDGLPADAGTNECR